jgi:4-amino-4-deoxy-L-arabinose transferase-like glycosyltransferase
MKCSTVAIWLGLFLSLFYIATARGTMTFGDDISMLRVTRSVATQASFAVQPDTPRSTRGIDGRYYSKYGIGQSVLGVPFYLIGAFVAKHYSDPHLRGVNPYANPITYFACLLGIFSASGAVIFFYLTCAELGFCQSAGIFSALALGTCTFVWYYARTYMTEPTSTFFLILAFYGLLRFTKDSRLVWLLISGISLCLAVLVRVQNVVVFPAFALWLILNLWMPQRHSFGATLAAVTAWSVPIMVSFAIVAAFDYLRFGSATDMGFGPHWEMKQMSFIFSNPLYVGIYGFLFSPGKSLFWYAPILAPALYGGNVLWKKYPEMTVVLGTLGGTYLRFYSKFFQRFGGGCWGPRFMVQMLPFLMIGFAALIDQGLGLIGWIVIATTTALSFFIQVTSVLVSYIPYLAVMAKSPESFDRCLWVPAYSPVIVQAEELLQHKYANDLAYNTYPSKFLFRFQLGALIVSLVVFGGGIYLFYRSYVAARCQPQSW